MKEGPTVNHRAATISGWLLLSSLIPTSLARADGGAVRLRERAGGYQIAVFTSPTPFRAGTVDISVLVQDAATGECVPEARVTVGLRAPGAGRVLECPATAEALPATDSDRFTTPEAVLLVITRAALAGLVPSTPM